MNEVLTSERLIFLMIGSKIMADKKDDKKPKLKLVSDNKIKTDGKKIGYNPDNKISSKQEAFLQDVASGMTLIASYKKNYEVKSTTSDKVIGINASRLFHSTSCSLRYKAIVRDNEENTARQAFRREQYVLKRLTEEADQADNASSRIRALELLGKTVSMFSDKVEMETKQADRTPEEIEQDLKSKLQKLLGN